ncbi:hypothetical protein [Confluentibacter flavum]|uniref:Uncharacterized protein n=1 Tax=Confluentibacter flavum TaxID=1909700 RepID=A0A2N3HMB3_9FLAO|nr:hypothetical protein [Confluentibacter flavum]PKQ46096.1 hypothetical protein CSW08_04965 [Confluentibacter flavum]
MKNYSNQSQLLDAKITALENKQKIKTRELKGQLDLTYKELRPSRLLNRVLNDIKEEPQLKGNILESALSLVGGYLSKKILVGKTNSIFTNLFGYGVQYLATKIISKKIKH